MIPVIAFCGLAGTGKDTVARELGILFTARGASVKSAAFAGPLKEMCCEVWPLPPENVYGPSEKRGEPIPSLVGALADGSAAERWAAKLFPEDPVRALAKLWEVTDTLVFNTGEPVTARKILQVVGTEWGRALSPSVWVDYAVRTASNIIRQIGGPVIFTDGRFPNESFAVRAVGGVSIRLWRPGVEVAPNAHESERWISTAPALAFDVDAVNDGPPEVLAQRLIQTPKIAAMLPVAVSGNYIWEGS